MLAAFEFFEIDADSLLCLPLHSRRLLWYLEYRLGKMILVFKLFGGDLVATVFPAVPDDVADGYKQEKGQVVDGAYEKQA